VRLENDSIDDVILTGFTPEFVNFQFGCGNVKKDMFAVVTFRANATETNKIDGELLALEFVPKKFRFMSSESKFTY
jgi:hypothetical protein